MVFFFFKKKTCSKPLSSRPNGWQIFPWQTETHHSVYFLVADFAMIIEGTIVASRAVLTSKRHPLVSILGFIALAYHQSVLNFVTCRTTVSSKINYLSILASYFYTRTLMQLQPNYLENGVNQNLLKDPSKYFEYGIKVEAAWTCHQLSAILVVIQLPSGIQKPRLHTPPRIRRTRWGQILLKYKRLTYCNIVRMRYNFRSRIHKVVGEQQLQWQQQRGWI